MSDVLSVHVSVCNIKTCGTPFQGGEWGKRENNGVHYTCVCVYIWKCHNETSCITIIH
jgi:hypothetical protein